MNDPRGLMAIHRSPVATIWGMRKIFPYLRVGYGYASEAVSLEPGAPPGPGSKDLVGRPGTRAPHVWLTRGPDGARLSTLDLFGRRHVLLVGPRGDLWQDVGREAAAASAISLDVVRVGRDVVDVQQRWPRAFGVRADGAALVRPDGFVAWRARRAPPSRATGDQKLTRVLRETLCLT